MILEDDVRAGLQKMRRHRRRLYKTREIDMNKFKSFWGLMSGILLAGMNRLV